ncbi:MAG: ribonuclease D [Eggerthellaceae bacterium]|jgi:ribonuclease D
MQNKFDYIDNQANLEKFVSETFASQILAIDTEFLREKTYYPKLCLLQLANDSRVVIVDPFSIEDLRVICPLLEDEKITKLFHAGRQDIEILYQEVGAIPHPVFDTQIAATLLGHAQQIGYGALVHSVCNVSLKKMDSFTDWSRRPLSPSQLDYAADDVVYLPLLYKKMKASLEKKGRLRWLDQDFDELTNPENYEPHEYTRFWHLKRINQLNSKQMAAARELAAWREMQAQRRNLPRKWILSDEQIIEACKREPRSIDDLFMVRGIREKIDTGQARDLVKRMVGAMDAPEDTWPEPERTRRAEHNVDISLDLMMALVRKRAGEAEIAVPTLARHDDLVKIARGYRKDIDLLKGWRRKIVGEELIDLVEGRISLSLDGFDLVERRLDDLDCQS